MTVVAFSIGSFGDIIAVLQLAWDIRKSLSEASEYSDEINALIGDIDSFTHVLQTTKERLTNATNVPPSLHRGLSHALKNCRVVLERVQNKIRQHRRDNDGKYGARVYKALWAVCAWNVLGGKADVEALKRRLAEQLAVIDTLLSVLNSSALEAIDRRAQADGLVLTRILACVESFPSLIKYDVTDVPFRFFNAEGEALQPFRNLAWPHLQVLVTEMNANCTTGKLNLEKNKIQSCLMLKSPDCRCEFWFDYYIYEDPRAFGSPCVLVSPLFHGIREQGRISDICFYPTNRRDQVLPDGRAVRHRGHPIHHTTQHTWAMQRAWVWSGAHQPILRNFVLNLCTVDPPDTKRRGLRGDWEGVTWFGC